MTKLTSIIEVSGRLDQLIIDFKDKIDEVTKNGEECKSRLDKLKNGMSTELCDIKDMYIKSQSKL